VSNKWPRSESVKRSVRSTRNPVLQVDQYPITSPNNVCVLDNGRCCQVVGVDKEAVTCTVFADTEAVYTAPCDSRILGVFRTHLSLGILKRLPFSTKARKAMACIDFVRSEIIFIQLLHTI